MHPPSVPRRTATSGRLVAEFPIGSFAFIMATGIVSIAAALVGLAPIAQLLFAVNLVAFTLLWLLLLLRLRYHPRAVIADLRDHRRGPSLLTLVAGTCVLGNEVSLLTAHQGVAAALWVAAALLWAGLIYCPFALATSPEKPLLDAGIDGSWLLVVVASQALAIAATRAAGSFAAGTSLVPASLCLFTLGGLLYVILITLILYRWLFWPMRREQFVPSYWINMGAAAITAVAGARLTPLVGADPMLRAARGWVLGETVLFWTLASWWIPLLCGLTVWRGFAALGYRLENWSIVFPLGMYTTASWDFGHLVGLSFPKALPRIFIWVALTAWCLTFAGMLRHFLRHRRSADVMPADPG